MFRKTLIFLLILSLLIGCVSASQDVNETSAITEADDSPVQAVVNESDSLDSGDDENIVEIHEEDALGADGEFLDVSDAYDYLNQFRCEEGVWQWDQDDATKTYFNTQDTVWLKPLERDVELEETAKVRARELYQLYSHTRPDGTYCFTAFPDGLADKGENIAAGAYSSEGVTELWKETYEPYQYQGHRRNMLDANFNCVGIAAFRLNGEVYWVQDFGCRNNPKDVEGNVFYVENNNTETPKFRIELPIYATGNFIVKINGREIMEKSIFQGKANITIYGLKAGLYDVELVYSGDNNYKSVNGTYSVNATGDESSSTSFTYLNTIIKMAGDEVRLEKDYAYDADMDSDFRDGIIIPELMTIDGDGHKIDARGVARIFKISDGATLKNLNLTNASADYGAAVLSYNGVVFRNCTVTDSFAAVYGGAAYAVGQIHAYDSRFISNCARLNGGALFGEAAVIVKGSCFANNQAFNLGGAIYAQGTLSSENSIYVNNTNLQTYSLMTIIGSGNELDDEYSLVFANATVDGGVVNLNKNLIATQTVRITGNNVVINGNGYSIDALKRTRIFFVSGDNLTIRNITLSGGYSIGEGGAVYGGDGDISIFDSTFTGNAAETGAGVFTGKGNIFASNSRFIDNAAECGGAFYSDEGNITIVDSFFKNNDALSYGGGAAYTTAGIDVANSVFTDHDVLKYGGVLFTNSQVYKVHIRDSVFENNTSKHYGGAVACVGAEISNSTFANNSASSHGGAIVAWGDIAVDGCNFTDNTAGNCAGAIFVSQSDIAITSSNFINNGADKSGAIKVLGNASVSCSNFVNNHASADSGAIYAENIEITNSTFKNNGDGGCGTFSGNVVSKNSKIIENNVDVTKNYDKDYKDGSGSNGGSTSEPSKKDTTPTVVRKQTKITAKKKTFKAKAKSKKYAVTLKSGKSPVAKAVVYLKIKSKTFKATTNKKGVATFKIKNLKKKGTFKANVTFKGNKYYYASSMTVKIKFK